MNVTHRAPKPERASAWGIAFLVQVMKLSGPKFVKLLVIPVALYYFLSSANARKVSGDYLLRLQRTGKIKGTPVDFSGKYPNWLRFKHILSFSRSIVDRVHVWSGGAGAVRYQFEGRELMEDVLCNECHGALFLVSHLGNFDLAIALCEVASDSRFNIVLDTSQTRIYNQFRNKIFKSGQVRFIEPKALTPIEVISMAGRAVNGEVIVVAADRIMNANKKNSVLVDFLGCQAAFPLSPYLMAHLLEVPVYCLFALKKQNDCLIRFEMFEQKVIIPRNQRQLVIRQYAQKFAARLERECFNFPLQWYNFYDFWARPEPTMQGRHDETS